jgi:hypothetical protein
LGTTVAQARWRPGQAELHQGGERRAFADLGELSRQLLGENVPLEALFERLEFALESLDGHTLEIGRDWRRQSELEIGPAYAFDELMAAFAPGAHFLEDSYRNRLAFVDVDDRRRRKVLTDICITHPGVCSQGEFCSVQVAKDDGLALHLRRGFR